MSVVRVLEEVLGRKEMKTKEVITSVSVSGRKKNATDFHSDDDAASLLFRGYIPAKHVLEGIGIGHQSGMYSVCFQP